MARRYEKFTRAYEHSRIPFLLAEVLTDGAGQMVDLICRYANDAAGALLGAGGDTLKNKRFCRSFVSERLPEFAPLAEVAFSGSSATLVYTTVRGQTLHITCYQLLYGLVGCILDEPDSAAGMQGAMRNTRQSPDGNAVLELRRGRVRGLSFSRELSVLTGYSERELLNRFSEDFSLLIMPEDWPELLQSLLDSARSGQELRRELRLRCAGDRPLWVLLRAGQITSESGHPVLNATFLNIDRQMKAQLTLQKTQVELKTLRREIQQLLDTLPGGWVFSTDPVSHVPVPLHISLSLAALLGVEQKVLLEQIRKNPMCFILPEDRPPLSAALKRAADDRQPGRVAFRVLRPDTLLPVWISMSFAVLPRENGGLLLFGTCFDATREQESVNALKFYDSLTDLVLFRPGALCLDYDPLTDEAVFWFFHGNQRVSRRIPGYRTALASAPAIHPDDRKVTLTALRRACARPGRGACEYLVRCGDREYRRFRLSFLSLADQDGAVCRVIALGGPVSATSGA